MTSVVVCGGSVIGLSTAMLLARDGHDVTVLERDPVGAPDHPRDAWNEWPRAGVAQFHQPHNIFPRVQLILDAELPGLTARLVDAGCYVWEPLTALPPALAGEPRPGDDRFHFPTGRRPTVEAVFAGAARHHPGVTVRRGVGVDGLLTGASVVDHVPHVTGVRTKGGDELRADLVVDAMGRRSPLADWLAALGARPPEMESEDQGFVYYTRYYAGDAVPPMFGPPLAPMGTFSLLTLPGDNGTWSVTLWAAASDPLLREVRDPEQFSNVVRACPLHAHWLDGDPITGVLAMAAILDKHRRFVVHGRPVVTGVVAVGDAWACTNPSAGRGISVGLVQAQCVRDAARDAFDDPVALAIRVDDLTEARATPFFWNQIHADRARIAEMDALRAGAEPPPPADPALALLQKAMPHDGDALRAAFEITMCLALPQEVFARPGFMDKLAAYADAESPPFPGPSRDDLAGILSG